jgi:hypothetical protein
MCTWSSNGSKGREQSPSFRPSNATTPQCVYFSTHPPAAAFPLRAALLPAFGVSAPLHLLSFSEASPPPIFAATFVSTPLPLPSASAIFLAPTFITLTSATPFLLVFYSLLPASSPTTASLLPASLTKLTSPPPLVSI